MSILDHIEEDLEQSFRSQSCWHFRSLLIDLGKVIGLGPRPCYQRLWGEIGVGECWNVLADGLLAVFS